MPSMEGKARYWWNVTQQSTKCSRLPCPQSLKPLKPTPQVQMQQHPHQVSSRLLLLRQGTSLTYPWCPQTMSSMSLSCVRVLLTRCSQQHHPHLLAPPIPSGLLLLSRNLVVVLPRRQMASNAQYLSAFKYFRLSCFQFHLSWYLDPLFYFNALMLSVVHVFVQNAFVVGQMLIIMWYW